MKTLKINSFKITTQILFLVILFTSACTQSEKSTTTNNKSEIDNNIFLSLIE